MRRSQLYVRSSAVTMRKIAPLLAAAVLTFTAGDTVRAAPAASVPFLAHQAVYDLSLRKARGNAAVNSVRGRILYNFSGSSCEGYTTDFRQVSELESGESKTTMSDLRSTSWEAGDGKSYRFKIETQMNDSAASKIDGIAERDGDHVNVKLTLPEKKSFKLDGDIVFAVSTGRKPLADPMLGLTMLGTAAANCVARAIARAVYEATALPHPGALSAWRDRFGRGG